LQAPLYKKNQKPKNKQKTKKHRPQPELTKKIRENFHLIDEFCKAPFFAPNLTTDSQIQFIYSISGMNAQCKDKSTCTLT
jgi:hypothetical protein